VELKRLADENSLGEVRFASSSFGYDLRCWRPGTDYRTSYSARSALGGGIVFDAIHELDYLLWILGAVNTVAALAATVSDLEIDVEDVAVAALRFQTGAVGTVDLNFFEPAYRRTCVLVGSSASAAWDWNEGAIIVRAGDESDRIDVTYDVSNTYRAELEDFFEVVRAGKEPRSTGREGVAALHVAEAIKQSAAEARHVTIPTYD
jgi:predicted dehydrogenase